jgi:hypothetical protein
VTSIEQISHDCNNSDDTKKEFSQRKLIEGPQAVVGSQDQSLHGFSPQRKTVSLYAAELLSKFTKRSTIYGLKGLQQNHNGDTLGIDRFADALNSARNQQPDQGNGNPYLPEC